MADKKKHEVVCEDYNVLSGVLSVCTVEEDTA
jgi:hypothetical protein